MNISAKTPSGDVGLGEISVDFELGQALVETIQRSAQTVFPHVEIVDAQACAPNTGILLDASLATAPYVQIHWRDETPRVGGGTIVEFIVRMVLRDCTGTEIARSVAYGFGREENLQTGANWPGEDNFRPGAERALENLKMNLTDLFRDIVPPASGV